MKKIISFLCIFTFILMVPLCANAAKAATDEDFRAVWVSSVANLDFPSKQGLTPAQMKQEIDDIVARSADIGFNAIILQVRPCADALYKSDIFPWSEVLTGTQGVAPADGFDPLKYWVEKCHEKGIELHAWVNPYRVARSAAPKLAWNNPARLNPSWAIAYENGLYLDPGLPECRELIINGIAEIINNYDVDGIHMDDYFYPGPAYADAATYRKYGGGSSLGDWRRENVNTLIRGIQAKIKELNPEVRFGIAPFAIWQNSSSSALGSATNGFESYSQIYSDSRRWVKEGWIDYICPQIYWTIGYSIADYEKVLAWWTDVVDGTGVDLYVGHAAYREAQNESGWAGQTVKQLKMNEANEIVAGSIFFRAGFLNGSVGNSIKDYYAVKPVEQKAPPAPEIKMTTLSVAQPAGNVSVTGAKGYTIHGTCDPDKELYINGEEVTNRTPEGFFSAYVALSPGINTFKFTQENQTAITRVITVKTGGAVTPPAAEPKVSPISPDNKYYATVTAVSAWVYPSATTVGGSSWLLEKGQKDLVIAKTDDGKWVKLSSGVWIETGNVSLAYEKTLTGNILSNGVYEKGKNTDVIKWRASAYPAVNVKFEDNKLDIYFGMQTTVPNFSPGNPENTLISATSSGISGNCSYYSFTMKDSAKIEGVYVEYKDGELRLVIKKRKELSEGDKPLNGFKFVVDAGHGDTDTGAIGPMGTAANTEKTLNLTNALKLTHRLRQLGAEVVMTRTTDVFYTLNERTEMSRAANPDMFISIHANSMAETTDSADIKGLTVWYRNPISAPLSEHLSGSLANINPGTTRSKVSNNSNFYVCRPMWTPSVIIETSFMCNIWDFAWLISEKNQNELADAITNAILNYYK